MDISDLLSQVDKKELNEKLNSLSGLLSKEQLDKMRGVINNPSGNNMDVSGIEKQISSNPDLLKNIMNNPALLKQLGNILK